MEQILQIWPSMKELARDLRKPYTTVTAWRARNSIPSKYDLKMIEAAKLRGTVLTLENLALARAANQMPEPAPCEAAE